MHVPDLKIGDIRLLCRQHFEQTGYRLSFRQAYRMAYIRPDHAFVSWPCIPSEIFLSDEDFQSFIDNIPVYVADESSKFPPEHTPSDGDPAGFYIEENDVIRETEDITVYTHIPFINDGLHTHDHFEINYVYSGTAVFQCPETEFKEMHLTAGDTCFLAPDTPHNFMAGSDSIVISIMIRKTTFDSSFSFLLKHEDFLTGFFRDNLYRLHGPDYLLFSSGNPQQLQRYMQRLLSEFHCRDLYSNANCICVTVLFFNYLRRKCPLHSSGTGSCRSGTARLSYAMLMEYIKQNYSSVSLSELSQTFHYSPSFLSKLIRRKTGSSFAEIVRQYKLEHAGILLKTTSYSVSEICEIIGYTSCAHFSRAFKEFYGISPSVYRKRKHSGEG